METAILKHGIGVFAKAQAIEQAISDLKAANFPT